MEVNLCVLLWAHEGRDAAIAMTEVMRIQLV
jgi:hypothetical protein